MGLILLFGAAGGFLLSLLVVELASPKGNGEKLTSRSPRVLSLAEKLDVRDLEAYT